MMDTMQFVEDFEQVGFETDKARVLASAIARAHGIDRDTLVTKDYLDSRFGSIDSRFAQIDVRFAQLDVRFAQTDARMAEMETRIIKSFADAIDKINARLWTTMTVIAGIGATAGAFAAFFLK